MKNKQKINEGLNRSELEIEIPFSKDLIDSGCKNMKLKILNSKDEELLKHYFDFGVLKDHKRCRKVFTFDKDI